MDTSTKSTSPSNRSEKIIEEIIIWMSVALGLVALILGLMG